MLSFNFVCMMFIRYKTKFHFNIEFDRNQQFSNTSNELAHSQHISVWVVIQGFLIGHLITHYYSTIILWNRNIINALCLLIYLSGEYHELIQPYQFIISISAKIRTRVNLSFTLICLSSLLFELLSPPSLIFTQFAEEKMRTSVEHQEDFISKNCVKQVQSITYNS